MDGRLTAVRQGNPAQDLIDSQLDGSDGALHLHFRVNRARLAAAQALDGRYVLATNATDLDAEQTLRLFKGQDRVEKRFRTAKGSVRVHPLFVHSDARVEGLVLVTMLAVLVRAILERCCRQHGLDLTADRVFGGFGSLQVVDLIWRDGSVQRRAAALTPFQAELLQTLGWPGPDAYTALPHDTH